MTVFFFRPGLDGIFNGENEGEEPQLEPVQHHLDHMSLDVQQGTVLLDLPTKGMFTICTSIPRELSPRLSLP
eukprot:1394195-Amorphochlora_amoeboformis.AAC.2